MYTNIESGMLVKLDRPTRLLRPLDHDLPCAKDTEAAASPEAGENVPPPVFLDYDWKQDVLCGLGTEHAPSAYPGSGCRIGSDTRPLGDLEETNQVLRFDRAPANLLANGVVGTSPTTGQRRVLASAPSSTAADWLVPQTHWLPAGSLNCADSGNLLDALTGAAPNVADVGGRASARAPVARRAR